MISRKRLINIYNFISLCTDETKNKTLSYLHRSNFFGRLPKGATKDGQ